METNFIFEYEIEAEHDVAGCDVSPTTSDEENAAFADDPLDDAEWTAQYEKEMKANEELEQKLNERLEGSVGVREWRVSVWLLCYFGHHNFCVSVFPKMFFCLHFLRKFSHFLTTRAVNQPLICVIYVMWVQVWKL